VGIPLDEEGLRMDALAAALEDHKRRGIQPNYIYTIPTVQNPTGTIMGEARRLELLKLSEHYNVPIFEDDCYADLIWDGRRPPAIYALGKRGGVIHIGSFSKSIAPALQVGFIVAPWELLSRMLPLKTDAGSGALEQMVLAEYCAAHFTTHVPELTRGLRAKCEAMMEAFAEQFGTAAARTPRAASSCGSSCPMGSTPSSSPRPHRLAASPSIPATNGHRTRPTAARACGCASATRRSRPSGTASPRSPTSAAANSACRRGSPMSSGARGPERLSVGPVAGSRNNGPSLVDCARSTPRR
jgi:hypothetical protein